MKRFLTWGGFIGAFIILLSFVQKNDLGANASYLPNPKLTPGVTNPAVNQLNIQNTICKSGWTATIRPPASYTTSLKAQQIKEYGYTDTNLASYEEDHLISLELGGDPKDHKNLWPEAYPAARQKDRVETYLKTQICGGGIGLQAAQKIISTDWYSEWTKVFGKNLGANSAEWSTTDDEAGGSVSLPVSVTVVAK